MSLLCPKPDEKPTFQAQSAPWEENVKVGINDCSDRRFDKGLSLLHEPVLLAAYAADSMVWTARPEPHSRILSHESFYGLFPSSIGTVYCIDSENFAAIRAIESGSHLQDPAPVIFLQNESDRKQDWQEQNENNGEKTSGDAIHNQPFV